MADSEKAVRASRSAAFQERVNHFVTKAAVAVIGEGAVPGHADRLTYAKRVLDPGEPPNHAYDLYQYTVAVLTNATVLAAVAADGNTTGVTDNDLEFTVNGLFSDFAGHDG